MSKLDKELADDLAEAYGLDPNIWKYCFNCLKMQHHYVQIIAGIVEEVCKVCENETPPIEIQFKLKERPR